MSISIVESTENANMLQRWFCTGGRHSLDEYNGQGMSRFFSDYLARLLNIGFVKG